MAGNPACCLRQSAWRERFGQWMERGTPEDLLAASIYFDLRPVAGNAALAEPLRDFIAEQAAALPRFRKLLADNALERQPALNWRGALETTDEDGHAWLDLKLSGSAVFVDAARLFALAAGVRATGTRERLLAAAPRIGMPPDEAAAHVEAFDVIQMLRLRLQVRPQAAGSPRPTHAHANRVDVGSLSAVDRRLLKEALRSARTLQQRVALDYGA
jgi:CBS domain-containing protein